MTSRLITLFLLTALLGACGTDDKVPAPQPAPEAASDPQPVDLATRARELAIGSIIIDTHVDVPYRIVDEWEDVTGATEGGDYDYPRAVAGGLNAPFMSIYTPASLEADGKSKARAEELIAVVRRIVDTAPDKYAIALTPADIEEQFAAGLISLPLGMENGSPIEGDLANVRYFYDQGIRYITLAHSLSNHISDSSYDDNKAHGGLSDFGAEVVREMNRLGMMVDLSHVSDEAFWDVMEITDVPAIASHSSARHFTPGWERNMDDAMIKRLAEEGGVIMINFGSSFISAEAHAYSEKRGEAWDKFREDAGEEVTEDLGEQFRAQFEAEHGAFPYATLDQVLDHFDHVVELTGSIDFVGIGSDYDGVGDSLPIGLKDVSSYPNLVEGLLRRGYSEDDVRKILGGNLLRVWRAVEAAAENAG
ncbi:MAG: dipeptidase [Gammaproteobacteria bacterium]|nr:dipeptidase [Gammaproteobacteria bacterium]MDH4253626.1 dipeptidase [Gammaproteobacteria bacterium]MDH5311470.1 dipeptidase [Gammaproteobacteria bacterium]